MPWSKETAWFPQRAKGRLFLVEEQDHFDGMPTQFTARDEAGNKFSVVFIDFDAEDTHVAGFAIFPITEDQMTTIHLHRHELTCNRVNLAALEDVRARNEKIELVTTDFKDHFTARDLEWRETLELAIGNID